MADLSLAPGQQRGRPVPTVAMLLGQVRYANRGFWRTPVAAFFTIVFPLTFLVILSAIYGNAVIDPATGLRLAQYTTPVFAVFGACMACYMSLAIALAYARHSGVLKRLRGTPLPPAVHVTGRIVSSVWIAAIASAVMIGVGVLFYDVQIIAANVPALVLTFLVGTACFASLGFAVASVAPTPAAATTFANATLILLSFISGIFGVGDLPEWMDRVASVFPLKPFVDSFAAGFNPYQEASTPDWPDLAVMAAWGIAGVLIARRALSREAGAGAATPRPGAAPELVGSPEAAANRVRGPRATFGATARIAAGPQATVADATEVTSAGRQVSVVNKGRPRVGALVALQARYAARQTIRDPMSLFFSVAFPVLLVTFFSLIYGQQATWGGMPLPQYLAAAFSVYGVAVTGFVNVPGSIADARALRVLKRMRGTPLPPWSFIAGRVVAAIVLGLVTVALVFAVGAAFFAVTLPPSTWAATVLTFVLSICCFSACGMAVVALVDGPQAVIATALTLLLSLSFISDIFIAVESMPTVLEVIGWRFPLRHAVAAAVDATSGGALDATFWWHLGVVGLWTVLGVIVAGRFFHWEPRPSRRAATPAA